MKYQKEVIFLLRIAIGLLFLYAGITKLTTGFTAAGYLENVASGTFKDIYLSMAGNSVVDFLVMWGEILIGLAITTGTFLRFAAFMGSLMMIMFYFSVFPPEHGYINENVIYVLVFAVLVTQGAGRYLGVDAYLERLDLVQNNKYLRYLLG